MKLYKARQSLVDGIERTSSWAELNKVLQLYLERVIDERKKSKHKHKPTTRIKTWGFKIVDGKRVRQLIEEYQEQVCKRCPMSQSILKCPDKESCPLTELTQKLIKDILK